MMYLQSKKPFYYITDNYSNIQGFKKTVKKKNILRRACNLSETDI